MKTIDKIAWIRFAEGKILGTRSRGKEAYYLPGGKREPGESDVETLVREISEELDVVVSPESAVHVGTFQAQADGRANDVEVRMTCYTADFEGTLKPSNEIEEFAWLSYADRARASAVVRLIFDHYHQTGDLP